MNFTLGQNELESLFQIGLYDESAIQNVGITLYAFCAFNTETVTTAQFVFAKEGVVNTLKEGIEAEVASWAGTINASEAGHIALPTSVADTEITWTTNCPLFNIETFNFTAAEASATYEFTASFSVNGQDYTKTIEIEFDPTPVSFLSVSEFNDLEANTISNITGTIMGFATANTDDNNRCVLYGMYLSDGSEIIYVESTGLEVDSSIKNGYEALYTYGSEKTKYEIGDVVNVKNATKSSVGVLFTSPDKLNPVSIAVTPKAEVQTPITFDPTTFETASSRDDFKTVFAKGNHLLVKVVATEENPICIGSSEATDKTICSTNKVRIYFHEGGSQTTTTIKPDGTHTVATKTIASEINLGEDWWLAIGRPAIGGNSTNTTHQFVGSFYCVLTITSASFYMITMLPEGFNLTKKAA